MIKGNLIRNLKIIFTYNAIICKYRFTDNNGDADNDAVFQCHHGQCAYDYNDSQLRRASTPGMTISARIKFTR